MAIASEANHAWLTGKGAIPIVYDLNLETFHIDAFIDLHGPHHLDLAIELGVPLSRVNMIIAFAKALDWRSRRRQHGRRQPRGPQPDEENEPDPAEEMADRLRTCAYLSAAPPEL